MPGCLLGDPESLYGSVYCTVKPVAVCAWPAMGFFFPACHEIPAETRSAGWDDYLDRLRLNEDLVDRLATQSLDQPLATIGLMRAAESAIRQSDNLSHLRPASDLASASAAFIDSTKNFTVVSLNLLNLAWDVTKR